MFYKKSNGKLNVDKQMCIFILYNCKVIFEEIVWVFEFNKTYLFIYFKLIFYFFKETTILPSSHPPASPSTSSYPYSLLNKV